MERDDSSIPTSDAARDSDLPPMESLPARVTVSAPGGPMPAPRELPRLPGSKYDTLRYALNALLASGESVIYGPALSDDTAVLVRTMRALGAGAWWKRERGGAWSLYVAGVSGRPSPPADGALHLGNAGAALRLLLGIGALLPVARFETDHPDSLGRRPNDDLLTALRALGLTVEAREPGGLLPITLRGGPPRGGEVSVSGANSSQYLSALLYLGPLLRDGLNITVTDGLRSASMVATTLRALAQAGVRVTARDSLTRFTIPGGQTFQPRAYLAPGDTPSAATLVAAARALGGPLRLPGLAWSDATVRALVVALDTLGVPLVERPSPNNAGALVVAGDEVSAIETSAIRVLDCDPIIDSVPALVALAALTPGETRFVNGANLRTKESDRISDLRAELIRAGADISEEADGLIVRGQPGGVNGDVVVDAHDDHRLAQALAIIAIRARNGLTITGADAVSKSYPWFFDDLRRMGARVVAG